MENLQCFDREFLLHNARQSHIDTEMISSPLEDNTSGWLISSPSTWTFSKMKLNANSNMSIIINDQRMERRIPRKAVSNSKLLQEKLSLNTQSTPENTLYTWNSSETSLVEGRPYGDGWESWFASKQDLTQSSNDENNIFYLSQPGGSLSELNRNYGSPNLSDLNVNVPKGLSYTKKNDPLPPLPLTPQTPSRNNAVVYNPFPSPTKPSISFREREVEREAARRVHKSLPLDYESKCERPTYRARSNTAPSNPLPPTPTYKSNRPSNLSTCTTLDHHSPVSTSSGTTSSSTPLYMRSPTQSAFPSAHPSHPSSDKLDQTPLSASPPGLMDYMAQQSFFFHDDDESNTQEKTWLMTQKARWQALLSSHSTPTQTQPLLHPVHPDAPSLHDPPRLVPKSKPRKKKTSLGLRDLFGRRSHESKRADSPEEGFGVEEKKEEECKMTKKDCPKCGSGLEQCRNGLMVTCVCKSDMCFSCLRDWDFCEGYCVI